MTSPRTTLRVDFDAEESGQLDTLHRTIHWLDEMRTQGWNVALFGHLTAEVRKTPLAMAPAEPPAVLERKAKPIATGKPVIPQSTRPLYFVSEEADRRYQRPWRVQMRTGMKPLTIARYPTEEAAQRHADMLNDSRARAAREPLPW